MPVRKFRSVAEMPPPPRRQPGDPAIARALAQMLEVARKANPRTFPPGVRRYRSIEEMNRAQDALLAEHITTRRNRRT